MRTRTGKLPQKAPRLGTSHGPCSLPGPSSQPPSESRPQTKKRPRGLGKEADEEVMVIKTSLKSFCKHLDVFEEINRNVIAVSNLMEEFPRYLTFYFKKQFETKSSGEFEALLQKKPNLGELAGHLRTRGKYSHDIDEDYQKIRGPIVQNCDLLSTIVQSSIEQYEVCLANNIVDNMYHRVRFFFKYVKPLKNPTDTLHKLFYGNSDRQTDPELIQVLRTMLSFSGNFVDLKLKWFRYIPFLMRLQNLFGAAILEKQSENKKTRFSAFPVFPLTFFGRRHIHYGNQHIRHTLHRLKKTTFLAATPVDEYKNELWHANFNTKKFETKRRRFGFSMNTDGVSVSLTMLRKRPSQDDPKINRIRNNLDKYDFVIGADPGLRLALGLVKIPYGNKSALETVESLIYYNQKVKGNTWRYDRGEIRNTRRNHKWRREVKEATRNPHSAKISQEFDAYLPYFLEIYQRKQAEYVKEKYARMKLTGYRKKLAMINRQCDKLLEPYEKPLIFIGDTKIGKYIKGYGRIPHAEFKRIITRKCDVYEVNEFRTTKLCAVCHSQQYTAGKRHRYQHCIRCGATWNRDINAALNLIYIGLSELRREDKHPNFSPNTILSALPRKKK